MSTHKIRFFNIKKKTILNYPKISQICNYRICSKGLMNEFETAEVNEPSVFEPLKFYCTFHIEQDRWYKIIYMVCPHVRVMSHSLKPVNYLLKV